MIVEVKPPRETDKYIVGVIRIEGNLTSEQQEHIVKLWVKIRKDLTDRLVVMEPPRKSKATGLWKLYFIINNVQRFEHMTNTKKCDIMSNSMYELIDVLLEYLDDITQEQMAVLRMQS